MKTTILIFLTAILLTSCFRKDSGDYFRTGREEFISENYETSITYLDKAISLKSDFGKAYFLRGEAYYNLKNYSKAAEDYTSAIQYLPVNAVAYRLRGVVKITLGDTSGAYKDWHDALSLGDEHASHYLHEYKHVRLANN
jgi:tetratricopeptide (TPR) repeat protein